MSSESDSKVVAEDEDKKKYEYSREREEKEMAQIPSSSKHTPVHLKVNAGRRTHEIVGATKGIETDVLDNIHATTLLNTNVEYKQEKPWMKAGADISDYFNYGFDEESWKVYCKKQAKIHTDNKKIYTKTRVQRGHTKHGEKKLCCDYSSPGSPSIQASSESSATTDVTGGRPGSSRRVEGRCRSQMDTEMSPKQDRITSYHLVPPSNFGSLFQYTSPPPFLYQLGPTPLSSIATLDSGHTKEFDDPSTPMYPCSSGSMASSTRVINYAKAWECYMWQEKCDKDRDRCREHGQDKDSKRGRDRESESCSSLHNSGEERMRHRDTVERGHKRHRVGGEKEEHHTGRRHNNEGRPKSSCSSGSSRSRSGRDDGKDGESHSRHKRKKAKRKRKD